MFQANTNASLKNLEVQVGQLALNMENQSRNSFPSDNKKKNPKDCMAITFRSGRELQKIKEDEKRMTEKEEKIETEEETKLDSSEMTKERKKIKGTTRAAS